MTLPEYVLQHTQRGECRCGKCIDAHEGPEPKPTDHTVDMLFFRVSVSPDSDTNAFDFAILTANHHGEFADLNPFDGKEHCYLELGAWIGDQGIAMQYMALGVRLGVFRLLSPVTMLGLQPDDPITRTMIGAGYLSIERVVKP